MQSGIRFGVAGSNMEIWKTGCTAWRLSRSHRVTEWLPGHARISHGSRNFSVSFRGSSYMEELSLDICLATNHEFRSQKLPGICRGLVLRLSFSNVLPKLLV